MKRQHIKPRLGLEERKKKVALHIAEMLCESCRKCILAPLSIKRLHVTFTPMIIPRRLISYAMALLHILNIQRYL